MSTKPNRLRIAVVIACPIPFYAPHYRHLSAQPDLDLDVIYLSDSGLRPFVYHGVTIAHSDEVLAGYSSIILGRGHPAGRPRRLLERLTPELWRVLAGGGYDAVWIHGYNLPGHWIGFLSCVKLGIPILLRGESELMFKRTPSRRITKRILFSWLFPKVSAFLCIGSKNREFYRAYGVPDAKIFAVPYGIDNNWFAGTGDSERSKWRRSVRSRLGLGDAAVVFVNHSKHRFPKRPADVVRAFGRLDPALDCALILVGDGDQRGEVDAACNSLKHGHKVLRLGYQTYDELRQTLAASDVLVFASEENWGMAVNEGLAAGLAILCSDRVAGGIDMVQSGQNGYLFRSRDEADLARRMYELVANPGLVREMGLASRSAAARFGFEEMDVGIRSALAFACGLSTRGRVKESRA